MKSALQSRRVRILIAGVVAIVLAIVAALYFAPVTIGIATMRAGLRLHGFDRHSVDTPRGEVVYFEEGSGDTIVFLHGLQDQAGGWWQVAPALTPDHRVILPDLIGHGASGPRAGAIHPEDAVVQLDALLGRESPDEPVVLIGNSMGGGIALGYALTHPDRVRRLVLIDSAGLAMELEKDRFLPRDVADVRGTLRLVLGPDATLPPDFVLRRMKDHIWNGPTPRLWDHFADGSAFIDDRLADIDTPADIIWGTQDGLIPIDLGRKMHRLLPRSRFHPMEGCGHSPQVDCPDRLVTLLQKILAMDPVTP